MKVLLDTCVIYPTVMREMILGVAGAGLKLEPGGLSEEEPSGRSYVSFTRALLLIMPACTA